MVLVGVGCFGSRAASGRRQYGAKSIDPPPGTQLREIGQHEHKWFAGTCECRY